MILFIFAKGLVSLGPPATGAIRPMLGFVGVCILAVALAGGELSGVAALIVGLVAAGTAASFIAYGRPGEDDD